MPRSRALLSLLLALASSPAGADDLEPQIGDLRQGARLYRLHCAHCHGVDRNGKGYLARTLKDPAPRNLRDPSFLLRRSDEDLLTVITQGGGAVAAHFTMPNFGGQLEVLDAWDLIAVLRQDQPRLSEYFPDASRYVAKGYLLKQEAVVRLQAAFGELSEGEREITVIAIYGGDPVPPGGPERVPHEPRALATLNPKKKLGYMAFAEVQVPGAGRRSWTAFALSPAGEIRKLAPLDIPDDKARTKAQAALAGFEGQGGKPAGVTAAYPQLVSKADGAPSPKELGRAYARALEGILQYEHDEKDRFKPAQ
jgi:mono/diheme cytochrome c family protein